ncbi:DUF3363 domain-containing protein [Variovorax sp. CF313]|uniref:DUF3363 domain-containing protein n=1 Tax=Variovorax sp. CF313 TaxID=1144315 RepID=UPI002351E8D3|nr:DUF3363 domain-containing protein [Variovorax sp. CF313]
MALAERVDANRWKLVPDMARTLIAMGEREDMLASMRRAFKGQQRDYVLDGAMTAPVIGRIAGKGLPDELHDRGYLVVDGIDGRAHYLKLPAGADLSALPVGGIVEAKPPERGRAVDRSIAAIAQAGIYKTADHLARLEQAADRDPQATVDVHVRRLEALRRVGVAAHVADGVWQVPQDLVQKVQRLEAQRGAGPTIELRSHLPIDQQVRAVGATWLDRQLIVEGSGVAAQGFGAQVREAMRGRADFLVEQGLAERRGRRMVFSRNLLSTLRDRELATAGKSLQDQTGKTYRSMQEGARASGVYKAFFVG